MGVVRTRFAEGLLAPGTISGTRVLGEERSILSLPWLVTLICAATMSVFVLGIAYSGRLDAPIKQPHFVAVWRPTASVDPAGRIALVGDTPLAKQVADTEKSTAFTTSIAEDGTSLQISALQTKVGVIGAVDPLAAATIAQGPAVSRKSPYVHARLSLLVSSRHPANLVSKAAMAPVATRLGAVASATQAATLLYNHDLDDQVMLSAIQFPFETSSASRHDDPPIDPARFADWPATEALGFAPLEDRREAQQFANFDLGSQPASWRRLPEAGADDIADVTASGSFDAGVSVAARSFVSRAPGQQGFDASSGLTTIGGSEDNAGSDDRLSTPDRDPADGESEEAFFPPAPKQVETIYDAVQRAARTDDLSPAMTAQLLKLLSGEYGDHDRLGPNDRLDVYFSNARESDDAPQGSQLYLVRATFGGTYRAFYRFANEDGGIEYYGPEGRSARQFLLRNPVPSGRFRSGFGMRRHPILGYERMHKGVDWSAPSGTPILATADGTVEQVGVNGDFGLRTVIRHDNGYTTTYAHQSAVADGVVEGASVRQGQTIGFVGSTGLATGAHIHYEVAHDGAAIDPMQLVASKGPVLRGRILDMFLAERDRIDALVYNGEDAVLSLASIDGR